MTPEERAALDSDPAFATFLEDRRLEVIMDDRPASASHYIAATSAAVRERVRRQRWLRLRSQGQERTA